jgi:ferrochelatase
LPSVLLLNLGGPSGLSEVRPFLKNLFSDRRIIALPGGPILQPAFASLIAFARSGRVAKRYRRIGGGSPLRRLTEEQAAALERELARAGGDPSHVGVAMRYTQPGAATALSRLREAGERRVIALPLYPQECDATTGSSLADLEYARARVAPEIDILSIRSWHLHPGYIEALAERIRETLVLLEPAERSEAVLLFSAHSIPVSLERRGDPYVPQIRETVAAVLERLGGDRPWHLGFQSRTGPVQWVGPGTDELIRGELKGARAVVVVPVSFVSDHIETLYEIDLLFGGYARAAGIRRFVRCESLNTSPRFIRALADIVQPVLSGRIGMGGPSGSAPGTR